jgi:plastocyanin
VPLRVFLLAAVLGLVLPGAGGAQGARLLATVGPGFTISLTDAAGNRVTQLDPGAYEIVVDDKAAIHNFHLTGPGISMSTGIEAVGTVTWTVTLAAGSYNYVCDPHSYDMAGSFNVGTPPQRPTPQPRPAAQAGRLSASVGPGFTISLRTAGGRPVRNAEAGPYSVVVRDRGRIHNFHLTGPGVNRKTGIRFTGSVTWRVTFRRGATYRFICDPHARTMRGSFRGR